MIKVTRATAIRRIIKAMDGWVVAGEYPSQSSDSKHTVERQVTPEVVVYRCTCRGFKQAKPLEGCTHVREQAWEDQAVRWCTTYNTTTLFYPRRGGK